MNDIYSEIFGYILIAAALALALRERHVFRNRGEDAWLYTRRRLKRRLLVSIVLGLVGGMIAAWGRGIVDFRDPLSGTPDATLFTLYVLGLSALSFLLVVLALLDLTETTRNAAHHTMEQFPLPSDKLEMRQEGEGEPDRKGPDSKRDFSRSD